MTVPYRISPSLVGRYFFHACDRFIRYRASTIEIPGIPKCVKDTSFALQTVLDSGIAWESRVITEMLGDKVLIAPGKEKITERRWNLTETAALLRSAPVGSYIYQPTFRAPQMFYDKYLLDRELIQVRDNRPDLLAVLPGASGHRVIRVIDVKRGSAVKLAYRVQVLFYALELAEVLNDLDIEDATADLAFGSVWLGGADASEEFELGLLIPHLQEFLAIQLRDILCASLENVDWHICFRCEWCEYFDHCRNEMIANNDLSKLAGLTARGKRFLNKECGVKDLSELKDMLSKPDVDVVLARCGSLTGARTRLQCQVAAHESGMPTPYGSTHPGVPIQENVAIFLTAQAEPVGKHCWLLGMLVDAPEELRRLLLGEVGTAKPFVVIARSLSEEPEIRRRFIKRLFEVLRRVDAWNENHSEWKDKLSLQLYTYTDQERIGLNRTLLEALYDQEVAEQAMTLLFYLASPDLILVEEHPESILPHPVISIVTAIGKLFGMPVDVSYTLPEVLSAFGTPFNFGRWDELHFPLGHGIRSDMIQQAWSGQQIDFKPLVTEGARRLIAYRAALSALREHGKNYLSVWPPKHVLEFPEKTVHPKVSRLIFIARYESVVTCQEIRSKRCEPRDVMVLKETAIPLTVIDERRFRIEVDTLELEPAGDDWLVVQDSIEGMRVQARYNDYANRNEPWRGAKSPIIGVISIDGVDTDELGFTTAIAVKWSRRLSAELIAGEQYLLMPRYVDFTTDMAVCFLRNMSPEGSLFVSMLDGIIDPLSLIIPDNVAKQLSKQLPRLALTPSQKDTWEVISHSRVSGVWGPPGTGKTHFLASLVIGFTAAYARAGLPFRVLITAMTHAAIENLQRKICSLLNSMAKHPGIAHAKVSGLRTPIGGIEVIKKAEVQSWLERHQHAVIGSTVWGMSSATDVSFDMVIIDEASQLKVYESSIAIDRVSSTGRLVTAGDHLQLGPIMVGVYPDPPEGEPVLHGSIFELVRHLSESGTVPFCQLLENFRMNDILTAVSARCLYGSKYCCVDDKVAARRLMWSGDIESMEGIFINPDYPLIIGIIDGQKFPQVNPDEAGLTAQIAMALRDGLCEEIDDAVFFKDKLYIVSPHHAQIREIRRSLMSGRKWLVSPVVDTVDKIQGQEADTVIISYGVADTEFAEMEAEFIYGLNRLNVAVTRARCKTIIFLPRPLLEASAVILDNDTAAKGLAYMRNIVGICRRNGESTNMILGKGTTMEVLRLKDFKQ